MQIWKLFCEKKCVLLVNESFKQRIFYYYRSLDFDYLNIL